MLPPLTNRSWVSGIAGTVRSILGFTLTSQMKAMALTQKPNLDLKQQETFFKSIAEGSLDAIFIKDVEGRYLFVNSASSKIVGKEPEEVVGKTYSEIFPEGVDENITDIDRKILTTGKSFQIEEFVTIKGVKKVFLVTKGPVFGPAGEVTGVFGIARDISERQKYEDELRELHLAQTNAMPCISRLDHNLEIISATQAFSDALGYSVEDLVGSNWLDNVVESDRSKALVAYEKMLHTGKEELDIKLIKQNGCEIHAQVMFVKILDQNGSHSGSRCFMKDITERKEMEEHIRSLATAFTHLSGREFFEAISKSLAHLTGVDHVFIGRFHPEEHSVSIIGGCSNGNPMPVFNYSLMGTPCEQVVAHKTCFISSGITQMFPEDAILQKMGIESYLGSPLLDKDNHPVGILVGMHSQPMIKTEKLQQFFSIYTDRITSEMQRMITEEALRKSEERFRWLFNKAADAFLILDTEGRILDSNQAARDQTGFSLEELKSLNLQDIHRTNLEFENHSPNPNNNLLTELGERKTVEGSFLKKDRSSFPVETQLAPLEIDGQSLIIASVRDISLRKKAEEESRMLQKQLAQAQKMESLGQLAGGVAHDFNNLLSAIMLNLTIIQETDDFGEETRSFLGEIGESVDRATNLVRQMLLFSRRSVAEIKSVDLNNVIENLIKMLSRIIGERVNLDFQKSKSLACVKADVGMMEQIVMNLTLNARDAMPEGGAIRITTSERTFENYRPCNECMPKTGSFICLQVTDHGVGIEDSVIHHIFEPFFTTKEADKGTGLGLATVHGIVAQHNGWIEVESEPGQGSCFSVFIPKSEESNQEPSPDKSVESSNGYGTILVVEDEIAMRKILIKALQRLGYEALEASNAHEALEIWKTSSDDVDLLFTDMVMPGGMTGLDLANRIRLDNPGLGIIISSGYNNEITDPSSLPADKMFYLPKPYRLDQLSDALSQFLSGKK